MISAAVLARSQRRMPPKKAKATTAVAADGADGARHRKKGRSCAPHAQGPKQMSLTRMFQPGARAAEADQASESAACSSVEGVPWTEEMAMESCLHLDGSSFKQGVLLLRPPVQESGSDSEVETKGSAKTADPGNSGLDAAQVPDKTDISDFVFLFLVCTLRFFVFLAFLGSGILWFPAAVNRGKTINAFRWKPIHKGPGRGKPR